MSASANSGALSPQEIQANQLQVDSAVQSITRIASTTSFAGLNLLDGSLDYITSGVHSSAIAALSISQANLGTAVEHARQYQRHQQRQACRSSVCGQLHRHSTTLSIGGTEGVQTLSFVSGTTASAIAFAVNNISDSTGVSANLINRASPTSGVNFTSTTYGSKSFVSIQAQTGTFTTEDLTGAVKARSTGADAVATINGAVTVGSGQDLTLNTSTLDLNLTLNNSFGIGQTSFAITGGGANFQLGSQVASDQQVSIGIGSVAASQLGNNADGFLNDIATGGSATLVGGQAETASTIIDDAINQVAVLRGRLGAFEANTLETNSSALQVALQNVTSSESDITDANFAQETSNLTRAQILVQAGTSVLATANTIPQTALTLLTGH